MCAATQKQFLYRKACDNKALGWRLCGGRCQHIRRTCKKSEGIKKIAVLRADVDNLGTSFVYGFRRGEDERYVTLSRTAALSRQLSLFLRDISTKFLRRGQKVFLQKAVQEML